MVLPDLEPATADELVSAADLDLRAFSGLDLSGRNASHGRLLECALTDCRADALTLAGTRVLDTSFDGVAVTTLDGKRATWRDVMLTGCRFGVLDGPSSAWTDVTVQDGKVDFLNLRAASLVRVTFENCRLGELRLGGATVESVTFRDSRVDVLELSGATVAELDLRGAELGEHDGVENMRGVRISSAQLQQLAPALAKHVGLLVGEPDARARGRRR